MSKWYKRFNLQLFADDPASTGTVDNSNPATSDDGSAGNGGDLETDSKGKDDKGSTANPEKKYTDKDVDEILNKKFASWRAKHEKDVQAAEAEAAKKAKMSADEAKEYELNQIKEENEKLKAQQLHYQLTQLSLIHISDPRD